MSYPAQYAPQSAQVTVVHVTAPGPHSYNTACPSCHQQIQTVAKPEAGLLTYLLCGGCLIFGCVFGCCLIPFCVDSCQNVQHTCPRCNAFVSEYKRL